MQSVYDIRIFCIFVLVTNWLFDMVFIAIFLLIVFLLFWIFGGRELIGERLVKVLPRDALKVGDKMDVFMDGKLNRTATITGVTQGSVFIYDTLPLPVDYRGTFYASGVSDSARLVYLKTRKNYKFVRAAEFVKKVFNVMDDSENLMPDDQVDVDAESDDMEVEGEDEDDQ